MDRHTSAGARRLLALAAIALLAAACGSSSTPAPAASSAASPATPASQAPASNASSLAPASSPSGGTSPSGGSSPSAAASPAATQAASAGASGAVAQPAGTPCEWLDKTTIDATLGLNVGSAIPNVGDAKGKICTWISKTPAGGITLAIVTVQQVDTIVAHYPALPGGQLVPGLGVKAAALGTTGNAAPLPKNHVNLLVDYGAWGLSVDVSGPAVTVAEASAIAAAVVTR